MPFGGVVGAVFGGVVGVAGDFVSVLDNTNITITWANNTTTSPITAYMIVSLADFVAELSPPEMI